MRLSPPSRLFPRHAPTSPLAVLPYAVLRHVSSVKNGITLLGGRLGRTSNHGLMDALEHVEQLLQGQGLGPVAIGMQEDVAILCRLGNGQLPVLHGGDRHRARVAGTGGMVPDEKIGGVEGMVKGQVHTSLSVPGVEKMGR